MLDCSPIDVPVQTPESDTWRYDSPVPEFTLERLIDPRGTFESPGPEIVFVQQGSVVLSGVALQAGDVAWVPASEAFFTAEGEATLWRAGVPV